MKNKISIFFDTNTLESRAENTLLSLSGLNIPKTPFYDIINVIDEFELWENVEILIPDMVVMEMKHHLIKEYGENLNEMKKNIQEYRKRFGSLVGIDYNINTLEDDYIEFVNGLFDDFFDTTRNHSKIIESKKDSTTMKRLIEKATKTESPFSVAGGKGKKYTDAGFKDAVIYETIVEHINCNDTLGILFTQDKDYDSKSTDFKIINVNINKKSISVEDFKKIIKKQFNIMEQDDFVIKLKDSYIKKRVLEEAGLQYDDYYFVKIIPETYQKDDQNIVSDIVIRIDEDKLRIHVEYNYKANEIFADNLGQYEDENT